nr:hypothetical protein [Tanacetum cinerariifolium]
MIGNINLLWKPFFEKLNDTSTFENAGNFMAPKSIATISHVEKEELRKKGIKSPSNTDSDTEEEDVSSTNAHEHELGNMVRRNKEVKEEGNGGDEMETDKEVEEVFEDEESEGETKEKLRKRLMMRPRKKTMKQNTTTPSLLLKSLKWYEEKANAMVSDLNEKDMKEAMFAIGENKSPMLDVDT